MASHQVVKLKAHLVGNIQVSYCFLFIGDQNTLQNEGLNLTYLLVRECLGAVNHCQMLELVDRIVRMRIFFLVDWLHRLGLLLFFLLFVGVDTRDEETITVILNVLNVRSR